MEKLIIIGSGPAGLTAAIYAARAQLAPLLITGNALGGQMGVTDVVENYPGFPQPIAGAELTTLMREQAERFGTKVELEEAVEVDLSHRPFRVKTYGREHEAQTLIIATGATPRKLGVPGEEEFIGRGVSYCATCDGFFFRDKRVAVVGGGDAAVKEAVFLTRFASRVYIVHRRDVLRAEQIVQEMAKLNEKIEFVWDTVVMEILGQEGPTGLRLKDLKSGEESVLPIDGVFVYAGNLPNIALFQGQLELDEEGYIVTDAQQRTSVPGVFAAGDVQERVLRQIATAVGTGAKAAMEAERYIAELEGRAYPDWQALE